MSRKEKRLIGNWGISGESREKNDLSPVGSEPEATGWWASLGKFERLGVIVLSFLVVAGIFGASGLGGRIAALLTGNSSSQNRAVAQNNLTPSSIFNLTAPIVTGTPQLSREYIYAGSRMLAVEDANASAVPPVDLAVWRPSNGYWYVMNPDGSMQAAVQFGQSGDEPLPGDYDGDGKTDFCVYRPSDHTWYVLPSSTGVYYGQPFGAGDDRPVPADYDGDGKTDLAVYRSAEGRWYILRSSDGGLSAPQFGVDLNTDIPTPADYDGDGKADLAVWRKTNQTFYSLNSSNNQLQGLALGQSQTDTPVSADFDGDGRADYAVRSGASWIIRQSSNNQTLTVNWGLVDDKPVQNDYDGDGKVDVAVWRGANGYWYIRQSSLIGQPNEMRAAQWGTNGDIPVPVFYRR